MRKTLSLCCLLVWLSVAQAQEPAPAQSAWGIPTETSFVTRTVDGVEAAIERSLGYIGIPYRRGGSSPETGFDCSGFVRHVFGQTLGLELPHNAKAISQRGEHINRTELKPGDLVFFNTMRRAFSHVGIYLGGNLFVHAPSAGGRVRIEDMTVRYWSHRFNGARRIQH